MVFIRQVRSLRILLSVISIRLTLDSQIWSSVYKLQKVPNARGGHKDAAHGSEVPKQRGPVIEYPQACAALALEWKRSVLPYTWQLKAQVFWHS